MINPTEQTAWLAAEFAAILQQNKAISNAKNHLNPIMPYMAE
jgi:hypothetical protein